MVYFAASSKAMILNPVRALPLLALLCCSFANAANEDDTLYASYACQNYALAALKTLGKPKVDAARPATAAAAEDARWAGQPGVWHAAGAIQAQTRFGGAMVSSDYRCTVQKAGRGAWKLLDLQWPQGRP